MPGLSVYNGMIPASIAMDRIINYEHSPHYTIEKGSSDSTTVNYVSQNVSASAVNFTINSVGDAVFLDRKFVTYWNMRFTMTGTPPVGSTELFPGGILGGLAALRWMPIQSCVQNARLQINGTAITFNPSSYLEPLDRYSADPFGNNLGMSIAPSKHDNVQQYSDGFNTNINCLGDYFDSNTPSGRGSFNYQIVSDAGGVAVIDVTWNEPVIMSPLLWQSVAGGDQRGFVGLTSDILLNYNFSDLSRMWSIDEVNGPQINSIGVAFNQNPEIYARWLTPPVTPVSLDVPQYYPYTQIEYYPTTNNLSVAPGATSSYISNTITFISIPSKILIYVRERDSDRTWSGTDTYASIESININFNNKSGILADARPYDLYLRSVRNGLKDLPYVAWRNYVGSPLMLDFNKDISVGAMDAPDMLGRYNFYIQLNYTNRSNRNIAFDLYLVPFYDGIFTIQSGLADLKVGLVDQRLLNDADIMEAEMAPDPVDYHNASFYAGGSFLDKAKKLGSKISSAISKGKEIYDSPLVQQALPYAKKLGMTAAEAVKVLGPLLFAAGMSDGEVFDMMQYDGGYSPLEIKAAGLTGGGLTGGSASILRRPQIRDPSTRPSSRPSLSQRLNPGSLNRRR